MYASEIEIKDTAENIISASAGLAPHMNVFIWRARRMSSKLLKWGYLVERLKSSFRKFYSLNRDLIQQSETSLS